MIDLSSEIRGVMSDFESFKEEKVSDCSANLEHFYNNALNILLNYPLFEKGVILDLISDINGYAVLLRSNDDFRKAEINQLGGYFPKAFNEHQNLKAYLNYVRTNL